MTLPFDQKHIPPAPSTLFVLVHPDKHGKRLSLADGDAAGALAHCRIALAHARTVNVAVAVMAAWPRNFRMDMGWIKGLGPSGKDMVFKRTAPSCYASRYFADAAESYRTLVIAGFLNTASCVAMMIDALRAGHNLIFLRDAIPVARHQGFPGGCLKDHASNRIAICDTTAWRQATGSTDTNYPRHKISFSASTPGDASS
jgi:hypothetical protein